MLIIRALNTYIYLVEMSTVREQFQERFLRELFLRSEGFVLKGGAAMRALFDNHRLTKDIDLDFTHPARTADSLHNMINRSINVATRDKNIVQADVSRPGKKERTPRWKINLTDNAGQRHHVEIEVSRDIDRAVPGACRQIRYQPRALTGAAPFWVDVYDTPALIAAKLAALLGREVPRDVYDLDTLCKSHDQPDHKLVKWAINRANLHAADPVTTLWAHLEAMNWQRFHTELLNSLPTEEVTRMDQKEWEAMKLRVGEYAEALLQS